jgi:hypothetical protein
MENPWCEVEYLKKQVAYLNTEQGAKQVLARIKADKK